MGLWGFFEVFARFGWAFGVLGKVFFVFARKRKGLEGKNQKTCPNTSQNHPNLAKTKKKQTETKNPKTSTEVFEILKNLRGVF